MSPQPGIYAWSTGKGGVHHYRQGEPVRVSGQLGARTGVGNRLDNEVCEQYDTILVHMLWDEPNSEGWEQLAASGHHRMVFDIDDVMWSPDWKPFAEHYTPAVLARVWRNIELAHVVTTPSPVIAEYLTQTRGHRNVWCVPNTVPEWLLSWQMPARPRPARWSNAFDIDPLVVGYQGSPSHQRDLPPRILDQLVEFLEHQPAWALHFWGPDRLDGWPLDRVGGTGWIESVTSYYRQLSMDIGIGPLRRSVFNNGKSSLRAVEYAALGIPAVLSAGPAYQDCRTPDGVGMVEHGVTGLLVEQWESWADALMALARDPAARERMGAEARKRAAAWTTEAGIDRWTIAWNSA